MCEKNSHQNIATMEENSIEITILDILELAHSLRQEKLSIETEMNDYFRLQMKLNENSFLAFKTAWITSLHRQNLHTLIMSKPENRPAMCCQRATQLEYTEFVEAHKDPSVKYQHLPQYVDLLRLLHQSPQILARCLALVDEMPSIGSSSTSAKSDQMHQIAQIVSAGLYGNCIHGKDVEMMLRLLERLLQLKIASTDVPRRVLRLSSSSFAKLYHKFHEASLSSKLFLTTALHEPIMSVLIDDNVMFDFDDATRNDHDEIVEKLLDLSKRFITSLQDNWIIFPSTVRWLVQTMSQILQAKNFDQKLIDEILIDMVFANFICPAVVSPDLYGICDAPISENAQFNLTQIGNILQTLAMRNQEVDNKFGVFIRRFENMNAIVDLMNHLLENTYDISEMGLSHQLPTLYNIGRNCILLTTSEISLLVHFLRSSLENHDGSEEDKEEIAKVKQMLSKLPNLLEHSSTQRSSQNGSNNNNNVETSPTKRASKLMQQLSTKTSRNKSTKNQSDDNMCNGTSNDSNPIDRVLIIPLSVYDSGSKVQPLSEDEMLNMNHTSCSDRTDNDEKTNEASSNQIDDEDKDESKEKPARFSINQDDVSIGNTSDNLELEAVSEAPSNHSVASSLDLEENNDNDNLSDMVSANVSGRGTPNISGRDTPSSQVIDGAEPPQIPTPQMAKIINKARSDIDDKFCKFEIKKLLEGDETISIISDTWSTDVLASDSETIEASDNRNFSTPLIPSSIILPESFQLRSHNFDISETQSESAWSTDVLIASDSEKNNEMDNDDTQSITTRSDVTETRDQVPFNFRPIDPSSLTPRTPESPFSLRSTYDSPRQIEHPRRGLNRGTPSGSFSLNYLSTPSMPHHHHHQPRPFRQHSSESQSSVATDEPPKSPMREKKIVREFIDQQPLSVFRGINESFEEQNSKVIRTCVDLINPFASESDSTIDEDVERRRLSEEERSMNFDSRRNGMINVRSASNLPVNQGSMTDDVKQQQIIKAKSIDVDSDLAAKIENLKLDPAASTSSTGAISKIPNGSVKNSKSTGAIPKSISFDSTADKAERNSNRRSQASSVGNGGIFNKIKQGLRRKNRGRHNPDDPIEFLNGSPSHSTHGFAAPIPIETSDDILAKYRRKPSSSSDAATSDSNGSNNSSSMKSKSSDAENRLSNAHNLSDNDFFLNAKRKLRLVLSTSDCHACDVRNNNVSVEFDDQLLNLSSNEFINILLEINDVATAELSSNSIGTGHESTESSTSLICL